MKVSLLMIGNELTDGIIQDTNSHWIAKQLQSLCIRVENVVIVRDDTTAIPNALDFLSKQSDLIITSGGLGPTRDDLTRESVAGFFNLPLIENPKILADIQQRFENAGLNFSDENKKQALEIQDSIVIPNPVGTAPGIIINQKPLLASFPGVPLELKEMFPFFLDYLKQKISFSIQSQSIWVRTIGLPESILDKLICVEDPKIKVGTMAHLGQVDVRFDVQTSKLKQAETIVQNILNKTPKVKERIFSYNLKISFEEAVLNRLRQRNWKLAGAESCTGGWVGKTLTDIAESSAVYLGGIISYANEVKQNLLGVPAKILKTHGEVSFETALHMRLGIEQLFPNANVVFSITGIAGPTGGSSQKPVGTVFYSLKTPNLNKSFHFCFTGNRKQIRTRALYKILELMWMSASDLPIHKDSVYGLREISDLKE